MMTVAVNTGLRWSEQARVQWGHVDVLTGLLTVPLTKNGQVRRVPMNAAVRSVLMDMAQGPSADGRSDRARVQHVLPPCRTSLREGGREGAQETLRDAGKDVHRLEGFTWHGLRHTFASRLVMNGVDLLTVKELGGWRTLSMVQRYAHLAPDHLRAAVEGLVNGSAGAVEVGLKLDSAKNAAQQRPVGVS
jgi:site-specific recombinase XerD